MLFFIFILCTSKQDLLIPEFSAIHDSSQDWTGETLAGRGRKTRPETEVGIPSYDHYRGSLGFN